MAADFNFFRSVRKRILVFQRSTNCSRMADLVTSSSSGREPKRRRSALTSGRRSLADLRVPSVGELYQQVDKELPAEQHIEHITKLAFHHGLSTLGDEVKDEQEYLAFKLAAEEEMEAKMTRMRKGGLFQKAFKQEKGN